MSTFGFPGAVTALGHFGTGLTNEFENTGEPPCTLQIICDHIHQILEILIGLQVQISGISGRVTKLECKGDDHWKLIYSAIKDMRRELLRGKSSWTSKDK